MDNAHYQANAVDSAPELSSLASAGFPTNGSPALGIPATQPGAAWFHAVASELHNAITAGGVTPDANKVDQLGTVVSSILSKIEAVSKAQIPTGTIIPFAGATIPAGYLLCNGVAVSRTSYAALFGVISTLYGTGDGTTTFNLPDLRDRFLEGAGTNALAAYLEAGLPNITGEIGDTNSYPDKGLEFLGEISDPDVQQGALFASTEKVTRRWISGIDTSGTFNKSICFDASRSNAIYSNGNATIQPKSMSVQYLIKY